MAELVASTVTMEDLVQGALRRVLIFRTYTPEAYPSDHYNDAG